MNDLLYSSINELKAELKLINFQLSILIRIETILNGCQLGVIQADDALELVNKLNSDVEDYANKFAKREEK